MLKSASRRKQSDLCSALVVLLFLVSSSMIVLLSGVKQSIFIQCCQASPSSRAFIATRRPLLFQRVIRQHPSMVSVIQRQQQQQQQQHSHQEQVHFPRYHDDSNSSTSSVMNVEVRAKLVSTMELEQCGERLRRGDLVAFPTETVYGLGCNALDEAAIIKVFQAKERPLTDPLISHVTDKQVAYSLWEAEIGNDSSTSLEGRAIEALCERFWPGPLTLVAKAASHVPSILMANTGFVACRAPQHPISVALINAAQVPIAAPSANKFGHVSPTRSHHVWDDLKYEDVWIVKEDQQQTEHSVEECCHVGVESSVAKIEILSTSRGDKGRVTLLRQGAVSVEEIQTCLNEAGLADDFEVLARTKKATSETVANVAPGQTIRHYSPHIPSFILSQSFYEDTSTPIHSRDKAYLSKTAVIDFGGRLKELKPFSLEYRDLSESGDSSEATRNLFEVLRWAEQVVGADQILFPEIDDGTTSSTPPDALTLALKDRLTRAASGIAIDSLGGDLTAL